MKSPLEILTQAAEQGVYLYVEAGKLRYKAVPGALSDALKESLVRQREGIIAQLQRLEASSRARTSKLPDLTRCSSAGRLPLSYSQQRLWFIDRLDQGSVQYNLPSAFSVTGRFRRAHFIEALSGVLRRHDVLRACFLEEKGKPYQLIREQVPFAVNEYDFRHLETSERLARTRQLISDDARTPFRLDRDVMLRASIVQLADDEHVIVFNMHHIVSDAWSLGILIDELSVAYTALGSGSALSRAPLAFQYNDYVHWQQQWLQGNLLQAQLAYWVAKLEGAPVVHSLPLTYPRPERQSFSAQVVQVSASPELTARIASLCQRCDVTLFMYVYAALMAFLARMSDERDIVIGTPVAGRNHKELEALIGFFVNILPLRTQVDFAAPFVDLLTRVKTEILEAYNNQYASFDMLVEELRPPRSLAHSPVFQILLVMQQKGNRVLSLGDVTLRLMERTGLHTPYDLELAVLEEESLLLTWKYNESLFHRTAVLSMAENFLTLMEGIVNAPDYPVQSLPLISSAERSQLEEWGCGEQRSVDSAPLHELIRRRSESVPQQLAVRHAGEDLSFRELDERSDLLAHRLRAEGVESGELVALCLNRSPDLLVAILAVMKAGAAYCPVDPAYPLQRIAYVLSDSGVKWVLAHRRLSRLLPETRASVLYIDDGHFAASHQGFERRGGPAPTRPPSTQDPAYVIYTSGSTGLPKGVVVEQRQLSNFYDAIGRVVDCSHERPVWLAVTNYTFDISILELLCSLALGFTVALANDQQIANASATQETSLADLIERYEVTHLQCTPSLLSMFLKSPRFAAALQRLKQILIGGEALPVSLVEALRKVTGASLVNMYGPTETTIWSTCKPLMPGELQCGIGRPLANTRVYVTDRNLQPLPVGAVGELCIGGAGVSRGYLNRPQLTQEKFVEPQWTEGRFYRTGDKARWQIDGELEFLGRFDHQVKLRGFRVELGEIETALGRLPGIQACTVLQRQVAGDMQLVAYMVLDDGTVPVEEARQRLVFQIKSELGLALPDYMVPGVFVFLQALPLTNNGKVDRNALRAPSDSDRQQRSYVAPRNTLERALCAMWQELLKIERIGVEDNFFELGGHSLLSTQMMSRIRGTLAIEVSIATLFAHPTIAEFAVAVLEQQMQALLPAIEPAAQRDDLPLSYAQQRLWIIDQLEGQSAQYNMPYGFTLKGGIDKAVIERTLRTIIQRHESLRTRFYEVNGEVRQHVDEQFELHIVQRNLTDLSREAQRAEIRRISIEDEKTPFNLSRDLMIRAMLLILSEQEHVMLFTMHHIVSDGWSMKLLVMEFYRIYTAYLQGKVNPLPPLALQYGDFSNWQRNWLKGEVLDAQMRYWLARLDGIPLVHQLPLDKPRPKRQTTNGDSVAALMGPSELQEIKALCQQYGVTLFIFLQTVFALVLSRYSQQSDIVMSTVVAGRGHKDIEPLIGFFLNTIVLRTRIDPTAVFSEALQENKRHVIDAYSHQHVPFDMLVDQLKPTRSPRYNPVFQVMISLLDDQNEGMTLSQSGLQLEIVKRKKSTAKFELVLNVHETVKGLKISLVYNTDLFLAQTAQGMLDLFTTLIGGALASPNELIAALPVASASRETMEDPTLRSLPDSGRLAAEVDWCHGYRARLVTEPGAEAVRLWRDGKVDGLSFADLGEMVGELIRALGELAAAGEVVAVIMAADARSIAACLAAILSGRALVLLSETQCQGVIDHALADSRAAVVVGGGEAVARARIGSQDPQLRSINLDSRPLALGAGLPEIAPAMPGTRLESPLLMSYQLDSRGEIERTEVSHRSAGSRWWLGREPRAGTVLSLEGDSPLAALHGVIYPLLGGHSVILTSGLDEEAVVQVIDELRVTDLIVSAGWLPRLVERKGEPKPAELKAVYVAAHGIPEAKICALIDALPDTAVFTLTHVNTPIASDLLCRCERVCDAGGSGVRAMPVGVTCTVLDTRTRSAPVDCFGTLFVGPLPGLGERREQYDTGLQARWRYSGGLQIAGPVEEQLFTTQGRFNVTSLQQQLHATPGVRTALIRVQDAGGPGEQLTCFILPRALDPPGRERLAFQLRRVIADVTRESGLLPQLVMFDGDTLRLSRHGSVDFAHLSADRTHAEEISEQPATPTEVGLARIWQKVLGGKPAGLNDNFFALGGNSLLMILLLKKIAETFEVNVPMASFMAAPTIADLTRMIDSVEEIVL